MMDVQSLNSASNQLLPDVSNETRAVVSGRLSQVGMKKIEMPVRFLVGGKEYLLPALIDASVSLDKSEAKGIHMSRLYLDLKSTLQSKTLQLKVLREILQKFLVSHANLSENAYLTVRFELPLERRALVSGEVGYRQYPVVFKGQIVQGVPRLSIGVDITYSSTCPCSAALARQALTEGLRERFPDALEASAEEVIQFLAENTQVSAVPHSQRSVAQVMVRLDESADFTLETFIDQLEDALGTPVQSAVKRSDEKEFAKRNAENLMFCEDAARKIRGLLESNPLILDYVLEVEHQESLHPHDAVSRVIKGVPGGFGVDHSFL